MPVHAPALPILPVSATPPSAVETAPSTDSGKDFEATLSTALGEGESRAGSGESQSPADNAMSEPAPAAEPLAGGGNPLPPALPPVVVTTPEQIVSVVLEALTAQAGAETTASTPDNVTDVKSPSMPAFALPGASTTAETAVLRDPQVAPTKLSAALRATPSVDAAVLRALQATPATGDASAVPELMLPVQTELVTKSAGDVEHFKQAVMENMARLSSSTEAAGTNNAPAPFAMAGPGNAPLNAPAPATASFTIPVSFGQAAWGQAMGQQVVWVVNQQMSSADLHLSPPDLGPVSVRIKLDADQASISFAAAHGAVREAIEAALPRLREMLASQGIALTDANVTSQEQFHQAQRESAGGQQTRGRNGEGAEEAVTETRTVTRTLRLLDMYA